MAGTTASGGRNRKPIAAHRLRGTVRPSRHAGLGESVEPPAAPVVKPVWLSTGAAAVWDELAPLAVEMGTLTAADVRAFAVLCELQSTLDSASAQKAGTDNGLPPAAALRLERQTAAAIRPWYAAFGFDPQSRQRLHVPPKSAANPLDRFLQRAPSKWAGAFETPFQKPGIK